MSIIEKAQEAAQARYSVIAWEPVAGTAERLNVAAIFELRGSVFARTLIRGEVLTCMYGAAGERALKMIAQVTRSLEKSAQSHGLDQAMDLMPLEAFVAMPIRATSAIDENDLMRQVVLMNCSLSVIGDGGSSDASDEVTSSKPARDEWVKRIRQQTVVQRPDYEVFFNRDARIVSEGELVKFDFLSSRLVAQIGLLSTTRQAVGVKDARAKLWELELAKANNDSLRPALIFGFGRLDDVTLSDKQRNQIESNKNEIAKEASSKRIRFCPVVSESEAVDLILEMA